MPGKVLWERVMRGDVEDVQKLLTTANINGGVHGSTLLHLASENGHTAMVELLLESGAEINSNCSDYLNTPLHLAARGGKLGVVETLLRYGADVNCKGEHGGTPLYWAARKGRVEVVDILLRHGADINCKDYFGQTPLHLAVRGGRVGVVDTLLWSGVEVDCRDKYGQTPLCIASEYGYLKLVTALLQDEADVNCQGKNSCTPLHTAIKFSQVRVIPVLLEYGANAKIQCNSNLTPMDFLNDLNKECIDTLERHFIRLEAVQQVVGGSTSVPVSHISYWDQQRRNQFLQECHQELERLSENVGSTNFIYFDLLEQKLPAFRDSEVEGILSNNNHLKRFPIYGGLIDIKFSFRKRQHLLDRAVTTLFRKGDFINLPLELIETICSYLQLRDVKNIIRCVEDRRPYLCVGS